MATPRTEKERVQVWEGRIRAANKRYTEWSDDYQTDRCERYYRGKQWKGKTDAEAEKLYVINMVFATIETNKPSLIFRNPQIRIDVRPQKDDDSGSTARDRALLCQDTVQTFIDDRDVDFAGETALALQEAHFRFGVIEVGYTADWVDNPNAGKPLLTSDDTQVMDDDDETPMMQPDRVPKKEQLYVKRIPASHFRCSISDRNRLSANDWYAYYEWHYVSDIKANPKYKKGASGLKSSASVAQDSRESDTTTDQSENERHHGMVKVWKIWDLRGGHHVIADGHSKFLIEDEDYEFLPHSVIKFYEELDSFYPIPPVYNSIDPQDEVNETREAQRAHRRRFYRRYTYQRGSIDPTELDKLETGGDGVYAMSNQPNPLTPVADAPLSSDVWRHLDESKVDFLTVSGVSGDQRGVAESETATQANIIESHSRLRESSLRQKVADWLSDIARLILLTIREDMLLPFWIKRNVDTVSIPVNEGSEVQKVAKLWQEIVSEDVADLDFLVHVDLSSMSPVTQQAELNSWNQVLNLLTNPALLTIMGISPAILRKTLTLYGIRSETDIQEVQKAIQQLMMMQMAAQQAAAAAGPGKTGGGGNAAGAMGGGPVAGETPAELGGVVM